jgi:PII-like signaling protein
MRRYLIVANKTLGGVQLLETVAERVRQGPAHFRVLVPVPPGDGPDAYEDALREAQARLEVEVERLEQIGASVDGQHAETDPFDAITAALADERFDGVILCTLPVGLSRWLHHDLVDRVRAATDVPVVHLTAPAGMPSRLTSRAVRLTIYVGESDRHGQHPLYTEIVHRARDAGLAGATVVRGVEGFGASQVVHTARLLTLSEDLPMVVHIIDTPDRVEAFLPVLDALITEGLVVREDVDVIKYAGRQPA